MPCFFFFTTDKSKVFWERRSIQGWGIVLRNKTVLYTGNGHDRDHERNPGKQRWPWKQINIHETNLARQTEPLSSSLDLTHATDKEVKVIGRTFLLSRSSRPIRLVLVQQTLVNALVWSKMEQWRQPITVFSTEISHIAASMLISLVAVIVYNW